MANANELYGVVEQLPGLRCAAVDNPYGSILSVDLGDMGLRPDAMPHEKPHGWRHLTVFSPWRLDDGEEIIADSNVTGGVRGAITGLLQPLVGATVSAAKTSAPAWDLVLEWSNGLRLSVFGDFDDDRDHAWMILGTDGVNAVARPRARAIRGLSNVPGTVSFIHQLAGRIPALRVRLEEHIAANNELLPHVFMGDVSRFAVEEYRRCVSGQPDAEASLTVLFSAVEMAARDGGEDVKELISVSFLENLAAELAESPGFRTVLGPTLNDELEPILRAFGY